MKICVSMFLILKGKEGTKFWNVKWGKTRCYHWLQPNRVKKDSVQDTGANGPVKLHQGTLVNRLWGEKWFLVNIWECPVGRYQNQKVLENKTILEQNVVHILVGFMNNYLRSVGRFNEKKLNFLYPCSSLKPYTTPSALKIWSLVQFSKWNHLVLFGVCFLAPKCWSRKISCVCCVLFASFV